MKRAAHVQMFPIRVHIEPPYELFGSDRFISLKAAKRLYAQLGRDIAREQERASKEVP